MSEQPPTGVIRSLEEVKRRRCVGLFPAALLVVLSYASHRTVPELETTDKGLVHVQSHNLFDPAL